MATKQSSFITMMLNAFKDKQVRVQRYCDTFIIQTRTRTKLLKFEVNNKVTLRMHGDWFDEWPWMPKNLTHIDKLIPTNPKTIAKIRRLANEAINEELSKIA